MSYLVYKTINLVNGKYYIGSHRGTREDSYLGSGKLLKGPTYGFKGKIHTEQTKRKIGLTNSKKQKGIKNSAYGKHWITNSITSENKMILKTTQLPDGWIKGRNYVRT